MQKIQQFMYGRYGGDTFSIALLVIGCIFSLVGSFFFPLMIIAYAIYLYAIFRAFSRNITARQKELNWFLRIWNPIRAWFSVQKRKFADRKTYKYFKCPNCKQNLRAPKGSGKIMVTCQKCHKEFTTKT